MDDINLRGLTPEAAKAYVMEFLTSLKMTDQELVRLKEELATWAKRVELAASKAAADLEAAARARATELSAKISQLEAERSELSYKIGRMREQLPMLAAGQRSIDADQLLVELQMAAGGLPGEEPKPDPTAGINALAADDALAELKRKLAGGNGD
ncbi:MAG: chromosome partitioning protein [Spirochaetes bacterium]|nr:chromosome partitioning protein [Spirochaetota bacterium]MBU0956974.1 chromosome partitioning protein [Spirochaetota bacterium]